MFGYAFVPHMAASYFFYIAVSFIIQSEKTAKVSSHTAAFKILWSHIKDPTSGQFTCWQKIQFQNLAARLLGPAVYLPGAGLRRVASLAQEDCEVLGLTVSKDRLNDDQAPLMKPDDDTVYQDDSPLVDSDGSVEMKSSGQQKEAVKDDGVVCLSTSCIKRSCRTFCVFTLTLIVLALLSLPSFIFVLSTNVPHDGSAAYISSKVFWESFGNSGFLAILTGIIDAVVVPELARFYVWAEGDMKTLLNHISEVLVCAGTYSSDNLPLKMTVIKNKKVLSTMIYMSFLLSVIMPLGWNLMLDHSCFRYKNQLLLSQTLAMLIITSANTARSIWLTSLLCDAAVAL